MVVFWLTAAIFWVAAPLELFRLDVILLALALLSLGCHVTLDGVAGLESLRRDAEAARAWGHSMRGRPAGWLLGATACIAAVRVIRGTAAPPLGWDSLTYHLFKAGLWVQQGGLSPHSAPDAWGYYEYFPIIGDIYWAWAMLPFSGDLAVALAGAAIWSCVVLATYACAVTMKATPDHAAMAAAGVGAMPATLAYLSSAYVDNTTLALFLLGGLFLARVFVERRPQEAPFAVAAFALMMGVKFTATVLFGLGALWMLVGIVRSPVSWQTRRIVLLACIAVAVVGGSSYLRSWVEVGTPLYPFHIEIGDIVLSEGSDDRGKVAQFVMGDERYLLDSAWDFWAFYLYRGWAFVNPGPGLLVFVALALMALPSIWRDQRQRVVAAFFLVVIMVLVLAFLSDNMEVFRRTFKASTSGRYVTPGIAALAILGSRWNRKSAALLWGAAVVSGLLLAFPRGWAPSEVRATSIVAATTLVAALLTAVLWWFHARGRIRPVVASAVAILIAALWGGCVGGTRIVYRYDVYAEAADQVSPVFHMHPLNSFYAAAWPIWEALDDESGYRLAVTAGWDQIGHNWYQYPLLGHRLQNRVRYIPITESGSIVDYRNPDEVMRRGDAEAWLRRLCEARVDYVVSLAPRRTIEELWMRTFPAIFEPEISGGHDLHMAFRFDREAAEAALAEPATVPTRDHPVP